MLKIGCVLDLIQPEARIQFQVKPVSNEAVPNRFVFDFYFHSSFIIGPPGQLITAGNAATIADGSLQTLCVIVAGPYNTYVEIEVGENWNCISHPFVRIIFRHLHPVHYPLMIRKALAQLLYHNHRDRGPFYPRHCHYVHVRI